MRPRYFRQQQQNAQLLSPPQWPPPLSHAPAIFDILMNFRLRYAFLFPVVNSRAELVASPRDKARNGASRRWLGDYRLFKQTQYIVTIYMKEIYVKKLYVLTKIRC